MRAQVRMRALDLCAAEFTQQRVCVRARMKLANWLTQCRHLRTGCSASNLEAFVCVCATRPDDAYDNK